MYDVCEENGEVKQDPTVRLSDRVLESKIKSLLIESSRRCRVFRVKWRGSKVPSGAIVGNSTIGWTQHGIVLDKSGNQIGSYTRVKEFDGPNHDEQEILVYLK
jgi:hypothetical protein